MPFNIHIPSMSSMPSMPSHISSVPSIPPMNTISNIVPQQVKPTLPVLASVAKTMSLGTPVGAAIAIGHEIQAHPGIAEDTLGKIGSGLKAAETKTATTIDRVGNDASKVAGSAIKGAEKVGGAVAGGIENMMYIGMGAGVLVLGLYLMKK